MQQRRRPAVVLLFALMGILLAACSGGPNLSDGANAAVINGQAISMTRFLALTQMIDGFSLVGDPSLPTWQLDRGRAAHEKSQQLVLQTLMTNMLVDQNAPKLLTDAAWKKVPGLEDAQLKTLFAQVPPQYQPLVNQGLLTPDNYRPFIHQQIVEQLLQDPASLRAPLKTDVAHIKIMTAKTKAQADALLAQLTKGGDWATLATNNSVDPAQASGGDIAVLPPGYLPLEADAVVFGAKAAPLNKVVEVQNRLGYSLIEVISRNAGVLVSALDNTQPIIANTQVSAQGAAINGLVTQWARAAKVGMNVNWCGDVSGAACPSALNLDQV